MPLLPSHTLLQTYSITLLLTSYILHTSPSTILSSTSLWLLGESMHIAPATFTTTHSIPTPAVVSTLTQELFSMIAFILLLSALTQSILATPLQYSKSALTNLATRSISSSKSASTPSSQLEAEDSKSAFAEKLYNLHSTQTIFLTLSAVRVLLEGAFIAYIYLFYSTRSQVTASNFATTTSASSSTTEAGAGILSSLANRVVFTIAMADMLFWGYIWTVLRDEAREVAGLVGKRRQLEEMELEMEQSR